VLLPGLRVASEQGAGRAVVKEDGNRVVVGLGEELARWRGDKVPVSTAGIVLLFSPIRVGRFRREGDS
jgi:hypothetical protein